MAAPVLAVGDGALGFWAAVQEVFPKTKEQRCLSSPAAQRAVELRLLHRRFSPGRVHRLRYAAQHDLGVRRSTS